MKAGYVQATWLLTGEDKPLENRVKPRANLSLTEGTWGAFELAARVAFLDTSDGEDAGVVLPTTNQRTTELTLGLNWWWTPNVCLRIDWERFRFDEDRPVKTGATLADQLEDHQDVFYVRWQIDF
jgi:phosphate-selective porin OprO/OprP